VAKVKTTRKQLFRAALALADLTMGEWAEGEGITASYLSQVLMGRFTSQRLNDKIDAFILEEFAKQPALAS
jgi:hypothetical protein